MVRVPLAMDKRLDGGGETAREPGAIVRLGKCVDLLERFEKRLLHNLEALVRRCGAPGFGDRPIGDSPDAAVWSLLIPYLPVGVPECAGIFRQKHLHYPD